MGNFSKQCKKSPRKGVAENLHAPPGESTRVTLAGTAGVDLRGSTWRERNPLLRRTSIRVNAGGPNQRERQGADCPGDGAAPGPPAARGQDPLGAAAVRGRRRAPGLSAGGPGLRCPPSSAYAVIRPPGAPEGAFFLVHQILWQCSKKREMQLESPKMLWEKME